MKAFEVCTGGRLSSGFDLWPGMRLNVVESTVNFGGFSGLHLVGQKRLDSRRGFSMNFRLSLR